MAIVFVALRGMGGGFVPLGLVAISRVCHRRVDVVAGCMTAGRPAIPGDMHASVFADRELRSPNRACRHSALELAVHLNGPWESLFSRFLTDVKEIAASGVAFVINQMNHAFAVHDCLWLDATVRSANQIDVL